MNVRTQSGDIRPLLALCVYQGISKSCATTHPIFEAVCFFDKQVLSSVLSSPVTMISLKLFVFQIEETIDKLHLANHGLQRGPDGLITWKKGSHDHPRNWPTARKAFDTTVIVFLELFVQVPRTDILLSSS